MAYFPNGDSWLIEGEPLCEGCAHYENCPIIELHLLWNYDAVGKNKDATKETALNALWPRDKDGHNGTCRMYILGTGAAPLLNPIEDARKLREWEQVYGKRTE